MWHQWQAGASFLSALVEVDRRTAEQVRRQPCRCCRGPLHAGHYGRKPRGLPAGLEARWLPEYPASLREGDARNGRRLRGGNRRTGKSRSRASS